MKKIFFAISLISIFSACNSQQTSETDESKSEKNKKVSKRDLSITHLTAYNNLFFDSLALEKFVSEKKLSDSIARRMRSFYNTRNYQYAWFAPEGLTEQARGFWNMHNYQTTYGKDSTLKDKTLQKRMDNLMAEEAFTVASTDKSMLQTELTLTQHFISYALNNIEDGYLKRKEMERFIPRRKEDPVYLADSLITKKHKDNKYYEDVNDSYKKLKDQLEKYVVIQKAGGWPLVNVPVKQLKKGVSFPAIVVLKKRLQLSGDLAANDTSAVFNDTLATAIMNFQARHGYTPDGKLTDAQLKDMNVPAISRIQQILINMGRMQWMVNEPKGRMIVVNIPEFILHVKDGTNKVFDMAVVVGKEGHNTTIFTGTLNQVVFSPYWNVPPSIVKKEILPSIEKNPGYLASQNMEITGNEGGLPVVRQLPGDKNSLGKVKFLFPNSFDIYFHDTPAKALFDKDKRAYSHGCIRLSDPVKMANYVLKDDPSWDALKIEDAMNSGVEKFVKVKDPIPVLITYYTAWVDDAGALHFADDIYNHDSAMYAKMFN
ncbi:MAG TPA: L,D-transpeptidase family protein [Ferruginibacter sp.]|nr:L,D-transpeptidase family protein [Ferruginibacter sp.]